MIPYLPQPQLRLFGLTFYAFGLLSAVAFLVGWWMIVRRAQQVGLDRAKTVRVTLHMLIWGYVGAHVLYMLIFRRADPVGIYSFGGIVSGALTAVWAARRSGFTRDERWRYLDVVGFVFPFAWAIARGGCALAHDHIGIASTNWIAVQFPEGPHLDLGLIESAASACLALCFLILDRRKWPAPFFFGLTLMAMGPFRIWLDTLHIEPVPSDRVFGIVAAATGCAMLLAAWRRR